MDLVDRYVGAVRRHLPATQQDDIVNELTDDIAVPNHPFLMLGPASSFLTLSPSWASLFYVAMLPAIGSTLLAVAALVRPAWTWLPRLRSLTLSVLGLVVISVAMKAGDLVVAAKQTPELLRLAQGFNQITTVVLVVIALITMAQVLAGVYRLVRPEPS